MRRRLLPPPLAAALLMSAAPAATRAVAAPDDEPRWEISAAAATATPPVLAQGLSLGATAELARRFAALPLLLSVRIGWTEASVANRSSVLGHHQMVAAIGVGAIARLGAGRLWLQAGGGASGVYEVLSRHGRRRIDTAGVPGGAQTSFVVGPHAFGEGGVAVRLRGAVSALLAAGPTLARTKLTGRTLWRWGGGARLGVTFEF